MNKKTRLELHELTHELANLTLKEDLTAEENQRMKEIMKRIKIIKGLSKINEVNLTNTSEDNITNEQIVPVSVNNHTLFSPQRVKQNPTNAALANSLLNKAETVKIKQRLNEVKDGLGSSRINSTMYFVKNDVNAFHSPGGRTHLTRYQDVVVEENNSNVNHSFSN